MESTKRSSCFVIAPAGAEIAPFLEALRTRGFEPFFISDFIRMGDSWTAKIRSGFKSVDLVIALLYEARPRDNVIFELGFAIGAGKPVLVFAEQKAQLPSDLQGLLIQRGDITNSQFLIGMLDTALLPKPVESERTYFQSDARAAESPANARLAARRKLRQIHSPRAKQFQEPSEHYRIESQLSEHFLNAGVTVAQAGPQKGAAMNTPDLALWVDDIQKEIGNPIAVEIKARLGHNNLRDAIAQLSASLASVGASAGILIHANQDLALGDHLQQRDPPIYIFSVDEMLNLLAENRFSKALKLPRRASG